MGCGEGWYGSRGILRGARGMGDEWVGSLDGCLDSWRHCGRGGWDRGVSRDD
jgi:hypothetical protein